MGHLKSTRKAFLQGLGAAAAAVALWPSKKKSASEPTAKNHSVKPLRVAHKAPRAVARENRVS